MHRRGPYKRYKIDAQSAVPRRTVVDSYHRREVGQTLQNENQYGGDILPVSIAHLQVEKRRNSTVVEGFNNSAVPPFFVFFILIWLQ